MRKIRYGSVGLGAPSILLIALTLCLTVFCTLAFLSAQADLKLSERALSSTAAWYKADAQAQVLLSEIDARLAAGQDAAIAGVTVRGDHAYFTVNIDDARELQVELLITKKALPYYEILCYTVIHDNTSDVTDNFLSVYGAGE